MSYGFTDIDHLMIRVADLSKAVQTYEEMGFAVTPPRSPKDGPVPHQRPWDNRVILFDPFPGRDDVANFLALACLKDQFGAPWALRKRMSFLWDTEGPKTVVAHSQDLEATHRAMARDGLEADLGSFPETQLGWFDEESGTWLPHRTRPCNPTFRQLPFMVNGYSNETLTSFRHKRWTRHANTARHLSIVTGVTDDIARDAEWMATKVFGVQAEWPSSDCAVIRVRDVALRIVTPVGFDALYPGVTFSSERILPALSGATIIVSSLDSARRVLTNNGVEHVLLGEDRIVVARDTACNTVLEFVQSHG